MGSIGNSQRTIKDITKDKKVDTAVEKAFNRMVQSENGDGLDVYEVIYRYKALRDLPQDDVEIIYDYLTERMWG